MFFKQIAHTAPSLFKGLRIRALFHLLRDFLQLWPHHRQP
eukprot:Gb_35665 [translate_table: standard]